MSPFNPTVERDEWQKSRRALQSAPFRHTEHGTGSKSDETMVYTIVIEETSRNVSAYAPDLPGCVATSATKDEAVREMRSAIALHTESLRKDDEPVPDARRTRPW